MKLKKYIYCILVLMLFSCSDDTSRATITGKWEAKGIGLLQNGTLTSIPIESFGQCPHKLEFREDGNYIRENFVGDDCAVSDEIIQQSYSVNGNNLTIEETVYSIVKVTGSDLIIDYADGPTIFYKKTQL